MESRSSNCDDPTKPCSADCSAGDAVSFELGPSPCAQVGKPGLRKSHYSDCTVTTEPGIQAWARLRACGVPVTALAHYLRAVQPRQHTACSHGAGDGCGQCAGKGHIIMSYAVVLSRHSRE